MSHNPKRRLIRQSLRSAGWKGAKKPGRGLSLREAATEVAVVHTALRLRRQQEN